MRGRFSGRQSGFSSTSRIHPAARRDSGQVVAGAAHHQLHAPGERVGEV
jgi:hypothetical protein